MTGGDREYISRGIRAALEAERRGNLLVGAVVTFGGEVIAEAGSSILTPIHHPGRNAETEALRRVPGVLGPRGRETTCYTSLHPRLRTYRRMALSCSGRVCWSCVEPRA